MAQKFFKYTADTGLIYGVPIDADLFAALNTGGTWTAICPGAGVLVAYDSLALLMAADNTVLGELPADLRPRQASIFVLNQLVSIPLPVPILNSAGGNFAALANPITITPTVGAYQGEQDTNLAA